jgi:hypothetical protein
MHARVIVVIGVPRSHRPLLQEMDLNLFADSQRGSATHVFVIPESVIFFDRVTLGTKAEGYTPIRQPLSMEAPPYPLSSRP